MEFCIVEKADHVLTVTLNRPERLNALHSPASAELGAVFDDYAADDDLRVAVITRCRPSLLRRERSALRGGRPQAFPHVGRLRRHDFALRPDETRNRRRERLRLGRRPRTRARLRPHHRFGGRCSRTAGTDGRHRRHRRRTAKTATHDRVEAGAGDDTDRAPHQQPGKATNWGSSTRSYRRTN